MSIMYEAVSGCNKNTTKHTTFKIKSNTHYSLYVFVKNTWRPIGFLQQLAAVSVSVTTCRPRRLSNRHTDWEWNGERDTARGAQRCRGDETVSEDHRPREAHIHTSVLTDWQPPAARGQCCTRHCYADRILPPDKPKATLPKRLRAKY